MYRQFGKHHYGNGSAEARGGFTVAQSGQLDSLIALERIGTRLSFSRNAEIYAEGSGADGRHIAEFCFAGDCFGVDNENERIYSAEAVDDVIVMRYARGATEQLVDHNPAVARLLREAMLSVTR